MNKKVIIIGILSLFVFVACGQEQGEEVVVREKAMIVNVDVIEARQSGKIIQYEPDKILRKMVKDKTQEPITYFGEINGSLNDPFPRYEPEEDRQPKKKVTFYVYESIQDDYDLKVFRDDEVVDQDCAVGWRTYMGVTWCPDKGYIQSVKPNLSPNKGYIETLDIGGRLPVGYTSYISDSAPKGYVESLDVDYGALKEQGYIEKMNVSDGALRSRGYIEAIDVSDDAVEERGYIEQVDFFDDAVEERGYIEQMDVHENSIEDRGYTDQLNIPEDAFADQGYIRSICFMNDVDDVIVCPDRASGYIEYFGVSSDVFEGQGYLEKMDVKASALDRQGYVEKMGIVPDVFDDLEGSFWKQTECYELMTGLISCVQAPDSYIEYFGISSDYYDEVGYTGELNVSGDALFGRGYTDSMNIFSDSLANQGYVQKIDTPGEACYGYIDCLQPVDQGHRGYL